jgi:hypothetical protein
MLLACIQVQIHNAVMASVPGHPFWLQVLQEALERAPTPPAGPNPKPAAPPGSPTNSGLGFGSVAAGVWGSAGSRSRQLLHKLHHLWEATPWHDKANAVLWSTGPMLLTSVYKVCCPLLSVKGYVFIYCRPEQHGPCCAVVHMPHAPGMLAQQRMSLCSLYAL